jgi:hypothetical protein
MNTTYSSLYVNGKLNANKDSGGLKVTDMPLYIGTSFVSTSLFNGTIDEFAIWNRTLSADEISALYSLGEGKYYWKVNATDGALGNELEVREFTIDSSLPALIIGKNDSHLELGIETININWTATDANLDSVVFNITYPNGTVLYSSTSASGEINLTPSNLTVLGTYDISLWANDSAANADTATDSFDVNDTIAPAIDFVAPTPQNGTVQSETSVYVNVSTSDANEHSAFIDWNKSLVLWMNFENVLSNGTVFDNSSYGNDGTMRGFSSNTTVIGKRGKAMEFDGVNDYVVIDTGILNGADNVTVAAWIRRKGNSAVVSGYRYEILFHEGFATGYELTANCNDDNLQFAFRTGGVTYKALTPNSILKDGQWHHVAGVYDGDADIISIYVDGVEKNSSVADADMADPFNEGRVGGSIATGRPCDGNTDDAGGYFNGTIDEVMVFNRVLTPEEINATYQAGTYRLYRNFTGLSDATYNYTAYAIDQGGNVNSTSRSVSVDTIKPQILYAGGTAANNTYFSRNWIYVNVSVIDNNVNETRFYLYNSSFGLVNNTNSTTATYVNFTNLNSNMVYYYNATHIDKAGNANSTPTRMITLDTAYPALTLSIAPNPAEFNAENVSVNWTATDTNLDDSYCNVSYPNGTLLSQFSANFTLTTENLSVLGIYVVTLYANDSANNINTTTSQLEVRDTTIPLINLISPANNTGDNDGNITFAYNVSDDGEISNCSLIINNNINLTNSTIVKSTLQNFTLANLTARQYNWSINCTDNSSNTAQSEIRMLAVIETTNFGGDTTDLSQVNASNITNLVIEQPSYGKINFSESIDLSEGADIGKYVNISFNRIEINSTALPQLNKSATLYLYNLTFTNPRILRDGKVCSSSICKKISYAGRKLTFNVTRFSVYSAEETPAETATTTTSGGGSDGGGGGGGILPKSSFSLSTTSIEAEMVIGSSTTRLIEIRNTGNTKLAGKIKVKGLKGYVFLSDDKFSLDAGETKTIEVNILAKKLGTIAGKLVFSANGIEKEVRITLEVETESVLFDVKIDIPAEYSEVEAGDILPAQVTLLSMGVPKKVDVYITYTIKNMEGEKIVEEYETVAVEKQLTFAKQFEMPENMKPGEYVISMEVSYADAIATSGELFTVIAKEHIESPAIVKRKKALLALIVIIIVGTIILNAYSYILFKKMKKRKQGKTEAK